MDDMFLFLMLVMILFVLNGTGLLMLRKFIPAWRVDPAAIEVAGTPPSGPAFLWGFMASLRVLRAYFVLALSTTVNDATRSAARRMMVIVVLAVVVMAGALFVFMKIRS